MVPVTEEEKQLDYYKYFERELAPVPADRIAIAEGPAIPPEDILAVEDRNNFLAGTDGKAEIGFGVAANGTGFVANKTFMKGVTVDMLDWWFAWHPIVSDLRYKLWDHDDHYYARANRVDYILDPSVPMCQKTWDVDHSIKEDTGMGPEEFIIHFQRPKNIGYDEALIGTEKCASMVAGVGEGSPALMTHKWYPVEGGLMLESRFWMGYGLIDGQLTKMIPDGVSLPMIVPQGLFAHNIKEFTNLASILPEIYSEHKDDF